MYISIFQRPVTAPAVMTMDDYKTHMAQKLTPLSQNSPRSSGYSSMDDGMKGSQGSEQLDRDNINSHTNDTADDFEFIHHNLEPIAELNDLESETARSGNKESSMADINESTESVITSASDKVKLMRLMRDHPSQVDISKRAKSAYSPRTNQLQNGGEEMHHKMNGQPQRSQSALGGSRQDVAIEDIAPMPYMDHSKPRLVSVGSIGKISLLESISEAKYWEGIALERQHGNKAAGDAPGKHGKKGEAQERDIKESEKSKKKKSELIGDGEGTKDKCNEENSEGNEVFDNDNELVEGRISSQSKRHNKRGKKASLVSDLENTDDGLDILAMIMDEEKRRKKLQKTNGRQHRFNFCSSAKSSSSSSSSHRSRKGSSTSQASKSSADNRNNQAENQGEATDEGNRNVNQSGLSQPKSNLKSPYKTQKGGAERHVILRTVSEVKRENKKTPNKYDRLIKRLGDGMTPYLKGQMLKVS